MNYTYDGPTTSLSVSRRLNATPERVFDAWLNPETASKWLFTTKTSKTEYELDARVGGAYTITRCNKDKQYVAVGEYLELDRPNRLVFSFSMPQFAADVDIITVEIQADGDGCILTVTQEMRPGYEKSTQKGWDKMLDTLAGILDL